MTGSRHFPADRYQVHPLDDPVLHSNVEDYKEAIYSRTKSRMGLINQIILLEQANKRPNTSAMLAGRGGRGLADPLASGNSASRKTYGLGSGGSDEVSDSARTRPRIEAHYEGGDPGAFGDCNPGEGERSPGGEPARGMTGITMNAKSPLLRPGLRGDGGPHGSGGSRYPAGQRPQQPEVGTRPKTRQYHVSQTLRYSMDAKQENSHALGRRGGGRVPGGGAQAKSHAAGKMSIAASSGASNRSSLDPRGSGSIGGRATAVPSSTSRPQHGLRKTGGPLNQSLGSALDGQDFGHSLISRPLNPNPAQHGTNPGASSQGRSSLLQARGAGRTRNQAEDLAGEDTLQSQPQSAERQASAGAR